MYTRSERIEMSQDETTNLGAGNEEPDPATAQNPPKDVKAGDKKRENIGPGPDSAAETGVGGKDEQGRR